MEKDYWTASGKFWQTVWRLRREEPEAEDSEVDSFITQAEVTEVVQQLLGGKAPGVDEIRPEYLNSLDVVGLSWLTRLCNIAWQSGTVPLDWATGVVVPLFKKGDRRVCSNYRGITLLSLPGKVYSRVLERRVRPVLEGSWEFAQPVHMCFVDLEKAFDRVPRGILWEVLWEYGVRGPLLRAVRSLYNRSRSLVRIASYDVVLLAPSSLDLQHALGRFAAECEAAGMRVSTSKSEAMVLDRKKVACTLQVGGEVLPQVEEFKYLGVLFTSEGRMDREIDRRIGAAAAVMRSMYRSVVVKKICQSIYVPTLTYGHELWVMTERVRSRIQAAKMSFLHRVAGRSLRDRVRSSVTREELGVEPLLLHIERGQLRWLGHLFRMPPGRLPGEVFRACPTGKRPRGRPRTCWRDYVSRLTWERLGVPPEELEEVSGERETSRSTVHITRDLSWSSHVNTLVKKARQRLYHLRRLKDFNLPSKVLKTFYTCSIESILTGSITAWFGNSTKQDRQALQRVVRSAKLTICTELPDLETIYGKRCWIKARKIMKDLSHPNNRLFSLLRFLYFYLLKSLFYLYPFYVPLL
ncbi:hypothetical protein QTP70_010953 [Hemibagrus guttatus]|uniref:Alkylated DNA repair protein AlkB homologue 8 N-terminal domain-containing protein n=1 Tax=Hemibagrus guttatus TaxID=175788 RepID=A0AAE0QMM1_9TELE|nr:hypothetical protein QTP70_010953 [Hemibagrus guttatus]